MPFFFRDFWDLKKQSQWLKLNLLFGIFKIFWFYQEIKFFTINMMRQKEIISHRPQECLSINSARLTNITKKRNTRWSVRCVAKWLILEFKIGKVFIYDTMFWYIKTKFSKRVKLLLMYWCLFPQNMRPLYRFVQYEAFHTSTSPPMSNESRKLRYF